jgi:hypothetical protein
MPQGLLGFQYEREKKEKGLTVFGGIGPYLDLFKALGVARLLDREVGMSQGDQGYRDSEIGIALILLNIVGGECVEDIDRLELDEGLRRLYRKLIRKRKCDDRRFRRRTERVFPSASVIFRYLERFSDGGEGLQGEAMIPAGVLEKQRLFCSLNRKVVGRFQGYMPERVATIDQDGTLVETYKELALYGYKGYKAYHGLNAYWFEQKLMMHTEFRPGNVPANRDLLRPLKEALAGLPEGVREVRYRADGAGYQQELLKYLDEEVKEGSDEVKRRFGRVRFAVSCPMTDAFRSAILLDKDLEWRPLDFDHNGRALPWGREWAEVCYVPSFVCGSKTGMEFRYFVTRQLLSERVLPGLEANKVLPFPVLEFNRKQYKVFGVVTNGDGEGSEIIRWHDERCGKSEEAHAILKHDLAGGRFPSGKFGANAAWWWFAVLAFNLQSIMGRVALGDGWRFRRMKAIRYHLIHLPGRIMKRSNRLIVRLSIDHDKLQWLLSIREKIAALARGPCLSE